MSEFLIGYSSRYESFLDIMSQTNIVQRFTDVFFIDASTAETIGADLGSIALVKGIGKSYKDTLNWVSTQHNEWLLLFNGADDAKLNLREYLPLSSHGNILITTRNQ